MKAATELSAIERIAELLIEADIFSEVVGALELSRQRALRLPAAAVVPLAEDADENRTPKAGALQRVTFLIGVVTILAAPNDPDGTRAKDELSGLLAASRERLIGWQPHAKIERLAFHRGRLLAIEDGRVIWQDEYKTRGWITIPATL